MSTDALANRKRLALLLWILVAFFYFYLSWDYIRTTLHDRAFSDYLDYVIQIAGTEASGCDNQSRRRRAPIGVTVLFRAP